VKLTTDDILSMKGRPLDGHINRVLEGKTIRRAEKSGIALILEMTNGERWHIAWATPEGQPIKGEPCLVNVNVVVVPESVFAGGKAGI
jgi:hypothetical protein